MFSLQFVSFPRTFTLPDTTAAILAAAVSAELPHVLQRGVLEVDFLSDEYMQVLNQEWRGKDTPTDVLSFAYYTDFSEVVDERLTVGAICLAETYIARQAVENHHTLQAECLRLLVHACFHILGFDHETDEDYTQMHAHERAVVTTLSTTFGIAITL